MQIDTVYAFVGGVVVGKFTNTFASVIISGLTLYYFKPELYTYENYLLVKSHLENIVSMVKSQ